MLQRQQQHQPVGSSSSSSGISSSSSSHSVKLEGCGTSRFQLHVTVRTPGRPRPPLDEADLEVFQRVLPTTRPTELGIVANRDEWHELGDAAWKGACQAVGACSDSLTSFEFCTLYCRPGYRETKLLALIPHLPSHLTDLVIADGLYAYADTLRIASVHLTNLETLRLRNSALGVPLEHDACLALAHLIRSLPRLRRVELSSLKFRNTEDWNVLWEALASRDRLEDAVFHRITSADDPSSDLAPAAQRHPHLAERRAVLNRLRRRSCRDGGKLVGGFVDFTESEHLEALLHVRSHGQLSVDEARCGAGHPAALIRVVSTLSDRPDLTYRLLRHETDPSTWACALLFRN